jgi:hypothetical protein
VAGRARIRSWLTATLAVVFAGSLAFSMAFTATDQPFAYFHTGARIWEFAAGGLLAVVLPRLGGLGERLGIVRTPLAFAAGWAGLSLRVSCGLVLRVSSQFPGVAALWPVVGAILVIVAAGAGGRWGSGRLLGSRPFVLVGGVAYAIYLWHWPVLVFARVGLGHEGPLDPTAGLTVLAVSFALALVTTRIVERPIRLRLSASPRPWAIAGSAAAILLALAAGSYTVGIPPETPLVETAPDPSAHPGAAALGPRPSPSGSVAVVAPPARDPHAWAEEDASDDWDEEWWASDDDSGGPVATLPPAGTPDPRRRRIRFVPDLRTAKVDYNAAHAGGCQVGGSQPGLVICERGAPAGRVTALLIGGSHATHWYPPLNRIAKDRGWRLWTALKGSCRFQSGPYGDDSDGRSCETWIGLVLDHIRASRPDFVITTATVTNPQGERLPPGYVDLWRKLDRMGVPIVAIRDTPRAAFDRVDCLALHERDPEACDIARHPTMDHVNPVLRESALPDNMLFVDVTDYLCTETVCPAVVGDVVVYRDRHHMTATYALTLTPMLAEQIPLDPVAEHETRSASS